MKNCKSKLQIYKFIQIALIFCVIVFFASSCERKNNKTFYHTSLLVGNSRIFTRIAATPNEQIQGLSGEKKLLETNGVLFDFTNDSGKKTFWMKDMNFNLDLI